MSDKNTVIFKRKDLYQELWEISASGVAKNIILIMENYLQAAIRLKYPFRLLAIGLNLLVVNQQKKLN